MLHCNVYFLLTTFLVSEINGPLRYHSIGEHWAVSFFFLSSPEDVCIDERERERERERNIDVRNMDP